MKAVPAALQAHLDTGATTLAWCWKLTRSDAQVFGFTDHDRDLAFDGTTYEAATGFTTTEIRAVTGLAVDNLDVSGALRSDRLNEKDLAAGLFDDAAIEVWRVNWADTSQRLLMLKGSIGEVRRGRLSFNAEVRGLAHYLQQERGRLYQFGCDATLGDARCGIDLSAFTAAGEVAVVRDQRTFVVAGPVTSFAADHFTRGLLTWTSGANAGRSMEVKRHSKAGDTIVIELWQRMSENAAVGDDFSVSAGCDKQLSTCKAKFDNVINFRGFPHMPGNDFVTSYPNSDDPVKDGSSLQ